MRKLLFVGLMLVAAPALADEQSVNSAFTLCQIIDSTGLGSQPCEVSGWHSSVTAYLDMASDEAKKTCAGMAGIVREKGLHFGGQWTLQIKSPFSGGNSIAYCNLPQ
jgi:hypothetical protein